MSFDLIINGKTVKANYGETLVDAGLSGWVAIPHDCCSGQCETCRVTVVSGQVDDQGTAASNSVITIMFRVTKVWTVRELLQATRATAA